MPDDDPDAVTPIGQAIADAISDAFRQPFTAATYQDEGERVLLDVLTSDHSPVDGLTSFATIGLYEHPDVVDGDFRVELVGACVTGVEGYAELLSTAGFSAINEGWTLHPGAIFHDLMTMFQLSTTLPNLYFTTPFLWDGEPAVLEVDGLRVAFLQAVPISDAEAELAVKEGLEVLEDLLYKAEVDVVDFDRPSVI